MAERGSRDPWDGSEADAGGSAFAPDPDESSSELQLLQRLKTGAFDDERVQRWIVGFTAKARGFLRGRVPEADIDDIIQEFWTRFMGPGQRLQYVEHGLDAYGRRSLQSIAVDWRRHQHALKRGGGAQGDSDTLELLVESGASPLAQLVIRESRDRVVHALSKALKNLRERKGRNTKLMAHATAIVDEILHPDEDRKRAPATGAERTARSRAKDALQAELVKLRFPDRSV